MTSDELLADVRFGGDGLVPVVLADERSGSVLTLAYANRAALEQTLATGATWLYSRSRGELWNKGATSGNTQQVVSVALDCDGDALIYHVIPHGPACHTGAPTCFERVLPLAEPPVPNAAAFTAAMVALADTIAQRKLAPPEGSYTAKLFAGGVDRIGKKIGEEATEVVIAAKNEDRGELIWETSDLLYHLLVMLAAREISLDDIGAELARRAK